MFCAFGLLENNSRLQVGMNLRLRRNQPLAEEFRRVVFCELELAQEKLVAAVKNTAALHDARKGLKRSRATLTLARPHFGAAVKWEVRCLRHVGRQLARHREIDALVAVLRAEARHAGFGRVTDLEAALQLHHAAQVDAGSRGSDLAAARRTLAEITARLRRQPGVDVAPEVAWLGYRKSYRRARRAYRSAADSLAADALHEWRKQAKLLLNQTRLLSSWGGSDLVRLRRELAALDGLLGKARDCEMLVGILRGVPAMETPRRSGKGLRARLQAVATTETARAMKSGRRLFRLKANAFLARMQK